MMYASQHLSKNTIYYNDHKHESILRVFIEEILELCKLIESNVSIDHMYLNHYDPQSSIDNWRVFVLSFFVHTLYVSRKTEIHNNYLLSYLSKESMLKFPCKFKVDVQNTVDNINDKTLLNSCMDFLNYKMLSPPSTDGGLKMINVRRGDSRAIHDYETNQPIDNHLSYYNVRCAYMENMTPYAQIDFCRNASVLIAPHGDHLTNLIFTARNCLICEICKKDQPETEYSKLCYALNKRYLRYDADDINTAASDSPYVYTVLHKRLLRLINNELC